MFGTSVFLKLLEKIDYLKKYSNVNFNNASLAQVRLVSVWYSDVSFFYFYVKSRNILSKNEVTSMIKNSTISLDLETPERKNFFISAYFPRDSSVDSLLFKIECVFSSFWPDKNRFWSNSLNEIGKVTSELRAELFECDFKEGFTAYDLKIKLIIEKYTFKYLKFLNVYVCLLKLRCLLVERLNRFNFESVSALKYLFKYDELLMIFESRLQSFACCLLLLFANLDYISLKTPKYVSIFNAQTAEYVNRSLEKTLFKFLYDYESS